MSYLKRKSAFEWAGHTITMHMVDNLPKPEFDTRRVMNKYLEHNNEVYERRLVHKIRLSDVEDPEIYAAKPLLDWQNSEHGKWIMQHGLDPTYHIQADYASYGYIVKITAHITPKRWTEYCLKFDKFVY